MGNNMLEKLNTEQQNPNTWDIDICTTEEILQKINEEDQRVASIVKEQISAITALVDVAYDAVKKGGRILYVGAGTSGRLGILDASECPPTYGVSDELVQGVIAGGDAAIFKAQEGAEDSTTQCIQDLKDRKLSKLDMVIGLAASGRTPYVIHALAYANEIGAATGSVCCVEHGEISKYAKCSVEVVTGAEVVTGSTRMKAGTAQKMVLNMISTSIMIKLGKVFHNYMVDVQPTNQKLEQRACGIIADLAKVDKEEAKRLFLASEKHVKTAIVMGLTQQTKEISKQALDEQDGHITLAVQSLSKEDKNNG